MFMDTIWKTRFHLDVFNVNHQGVADYKTYFNFMQESALKHAHHLGFGSSDLLEKNLLWVVTRFELHTFSTLRWDDEVMVTTWSRGLIGPYAFRDFLIKRIVNGDEEEVGAKASSSWIPIDVIKRRSVVLKPEEWHSETNHHEEVGIDPRKILYRSEATDYRSSLSVKNSDLDINRHVNNTKYIQWIYDSLSLEEVDNLKTTRFAINYNNEAKLGDEIKIFRKDLFFQAKNQDGAIIFSAVLLE